MMTFLLLTIPNFSWLSEYIVYLVLQHFVTRPSGRQF